MAVLRKIRLAVPAGIRFAVPRDPLGRPWGGSDMAACGKWRKQQGLGPSQIRNQLRRAGVKVSVHTVRRVMEEAGYLLLPHPDHPTDA